MAARGTGVRTLAATAVVLGLSVLGCSTADRQPTRVPSPSASPPPPAAQLRVPDVYAESAGTARRRLEERGFRVRVYSSHAACPPYGEVERQLPKADAHREAGRKVTVIVTRPMPGECGLRLPPVADDLAAVGRTFVDFARGERFRPPTTTSRAWLVVGAQVVGRFEAAASADPDSWRGCPRPRYYAARTCPFSALDPLRGYLGPIAVTSAPPQHPCLPLPFEVPPELRGLRRLTLTPDEALDCPRYYAVSLYVDGHDQVAAAQVVWSEP